MVAGPFTFIKTLILEITQAKNTAIKTIFTEAGLDPETPPATWDELEQYAEQIVEKTGKYGFDMAVKETILIFWGVGEIIIAIINAIRALYI